MKMEFLSERFLGLCGACRGSSFVLPTSPIPGAIISAQGGVHHRLLCDSHAC